MWTRRSGGDGRKPTRIVVGISCQIGRDGHRDMGDVSTYGKIIPRFDETSSLRFESLCRYSEIQVSQSISESENGKRPALSRKRCVVLNTACVSTNSIFLPRVLSTRNVFKYTCTCIHTHINKTMTLQIHNECKQKSGPKNQYTRYMRNINS